MLKYLVPIFSFYTGIHPSSGQSELNQSDSVLRMSGGNFFYHTDVTYTDVNWINALEDRTSLLTIFPYTGKFFGEDKELFWGTGIGFSQVRQVSDKLPSIIAQKAQRVVDRSSLFTLNLFGRRYYHLHPKVALFGQLLAGGGLGSLKTEIDMENDARLWSFQIFGSPGVHFFVDETLGFELLYGGLGYTHIKQYNRDSNDHFAGADTIKSFGLDFDKTSVRLGVTFMYQRAK